MSNVEWDGTGVGFGVRGSHLEDLTVRFTGTSRLDRKRVHHLLLDGTPVLILHL